MPAMQSPFGKPGISRRFARGDLSDTGRVSVLLQVKRFSMWAHCEHESGIRRTDESRRFAQERVEPEPPLGCRFLGIHDVPFVEPVGELNVILPTDRLIDCDVGLADGKPMQNVVRLRWLRATRQIPFILKVLGEKLVSFLRGKVHWPRRSKMRMMDKHAVAVDELLLNQHLKTAPRDAAVLIIREAAPLNLRTVQNVVARECAHDGDITIGEHAQPRGLGDCS